MIANGYVDGHISQPKNPVVLAKPQV